MPFAQLCICRSIRRIHWFRPASWPPKETCRSDFFCRFCGTWLNMAFYGRRFCMPAWIRTRLKRRPGWVETPPSFPNPCVLRPVLSLIGKRLDRVFERPIAENTDRDESLLLLLLSAANYGRFSARVTPHGFLRRSASSPTGATPQKRLCPTHGG